MCVCVCVCVCNTCIYGSTANYNNDINNNNIKKKNRMMKYIILFIAYYYILSINSITVSAQKPAADYVGLRLFLTEKGFGYLESVAKQLILKDLQNITIPDVNFDKDGFKGSLSGLKCTNFALENLTLEATKENSVELDVNGLGVKCSGNWKYKLKSWPHIPKGHGTVDISVGGGSSMMAEIDISNNNENNTVIKPGNCKTNVDITNLHFSGGISGAILNLLKKLIQKSVQSTIDSEICKTIDNVVSTNLQPMFQKPPLQWLACGVVESALFCDIAFPINGLVPPQGFPIPNLPVPNQEILNAKELLFVLDTFPLNNIFYIIWNAGILDVIVTPDMVPASLPIQLNTSTFSTIAPGMFKKWPNEAMDLEMNVSSRPIVTAGNGAGNITIPMEFTFNVLDQQTGVQFGFSEQCPLTISLALGIKKNTTSPTAGEILFGEIKDFECVLTLVRSAVGDIVTDDLNALLSAALSLAASAVNKKLEAGFGFPSNFGQVSLSNSSILYYEGTPDFYALGTDIVYNGIVDNAGSDLSSSFKLMIEKIFMEYPKIIRKLISMRVNKFFE